MAKHNQRNEVPVSGTSRFSDENGWRIWIDRGGTFTDIVALSPQNKLFTQKLLSHQPQHYRDASLAGIKQLLNVKHTDNIPQKNIAQIKMATTIATNALLEHRGEKVCLAITQGFGDALRIAYQNRPDIFALRIKLPQQLYNHVIEIKERVSVDGTVLQKLDEQQSYDDLLQAYQQGFRSLAIVCMHSYRYHQHELIIADIAKRIGFQHIALSHQASPLIKLVSRGDTTVIDAYLSPVIKNYIDGMSQQLAIDKLFFMQSNGGLSAANQFSGKNAILSGPAAGVVGAVYTAKQAGFNRIISFDMGGTSTDVAHYAGELERTEESIIAGFRLRAPMMKIHTIAAGGGSILRFAQGRYQVGPDSAGADPGPCCYRRNGPLTVTDCNVLLGRLHADYFPKLFGEQANQSIDSKMVKQKFEALTKTINNKTSQARTSYQVAAGFLTIAVNNMANAIKKISVERGYDVSQYTLCCFGGAGDQHACAIADELNIKKIFIHRQAGVLSALGIGLANVSVIKQATIEADFNAQSITALTHSFKQLRQAGIEQCQQQGIDEKHICVINKVHCRYSGSNTELIVNFADQATMLNDFKQQHQQQFGYTIDQNQLTISAISCELISQQTQRLDSNSHNTIKQAAKAACHQPMYCHDAWHNTPIYLHHELMPGQVIKGPAIIIQKNSTTIVEPNWQASVLAQQHVVLNRYQQKKKHRVGTQVDPVMLEIFNNLLMSIAEQMGTALQKTAYSVNIKERLDFSCAIFDKQGYLVANAPHIPVHLGSMSESVREIIQQRGKTIEDGDVYMLNDPYHGGTHLPDITVITPVFYDKKPLFYVASRGHHADIGGITAGSIPANSQYIDEEGILINNFTAVKKGQFCEKALITLLTDNPYPARNPKQNIADIKAQIAANHKGVIELNHMIQQFGCAVVQAYMQHIQDNAADCVRQVIRHLKNGKFNYAMDNGCHISATITVDTKQQSAIIDFSNSSPQQQNNFNAPKAVTHAAVLYVFRTLMKTKIPLNQGCFAPLNIVIPKNSLLNPSYPAAVVAGNVETSQCIVDCLYGALDNLAAAQGTMNNLTFGNQQYQYYETICGGSGAGVGFDGTSAVHSHMTNSLLTDPEILELRFPVIIDNFSIHKNSGGKGKWCGGDGVVRKIRFLQTMSGSLVSNHRKIAPYGLHGGQAAKTGKQWIERANGKKENLAGCSEFTLYAGDAIVIETPGGGGVGKVEPSCLHGSRHPNVVDDK